jgi:exopolysaccharide biosynthesis polyprenyl glycosylphosphotransferase
MGNKTKIFLLFLGDVVALYASLFLTLAVHYGLGFSEGFIDTNLIPFSAIFILWLIIFFIAGLYDLRRLRDNLDFAKTLWLAIVTSAIISIVVFYAIPFFGITPKTNLFIFAVIFAIIETLWRRGFNRATSTGEAPNRLLLIGNGDGIAEVERTIRENPQLGYEVNAHLNETDALAAPDALTRAVHEKNINCVVVPRSLKREGHLPATLYKLFASGILVMDLPNFYEVVMRKVPLADLEETWFLENIESAAQFYDPLKRAWEFVAALVIGIVLLPFEILIALIIIISSPGPVIYKQARVGKNGREFMLYKFRSMRNDAERHGAQWSSGKGDPRVTPFGRLLRTSHLDELPQLWNVLRGDISFVGPRPERPEFVARLREQIPYYETRLLVKPGITGWAQINHPADIDLEDVRQKLQYDIYYLKSRSLILDLAIIAKTVKTIFATPRHIIKKS